MPPPPQRGRHNQDEDALAMLDDTQDEDDPATKNATHDESVCATLDAAAKATLQDEDVENPACSC
ncbi:hypothetical protein DVH05_023880 [Phytophthora capsici]|nr:hypothetical protein DVH05_023880 [Phytophthora capsici]